MGKQRFERGAVVRCQDQNWIVWSYPRGKRYVDPIALPVSVQTAPQHRSHVRIAGAALDLPDRPMVIRTLDGRSIPQSECVPIGQCGERIVRLIELTMQRATEARTIEADHAVMASLDLR
jgi:hypothetical protein